MNRELHEIPMTSLNFYDNGRCVTDAGIDSFDYNGQTFKCDDLVVVGGQIGNIEKVNVEQGVCALGMSFVYDDVMARKPWSMNSGYRSPMTDIRHATDEETRCFELDEKKVGAASEYADRMWKERNMKYWF